MQDSDKFIILFDGVCNLCNGFVNFVIDRDPTKKFLFAPLQSAKGQALILKKKLAQTGLETVVLIKGDMVFSQSTAALKISRELSGLWPLFYGLIIVPPFIRNFFYRIIAKHRYRFFGKQNECRVPGHSLLDRFI